MAEGKTGNFEGNEKKKKSWNYPEGASLGGGLIGDSDSIRRRLSGAGNKLSAYERRAEEDVHLQKKTEGESRQNSNEEEPKSQNNSVDTLETDAVPESSQDSEISSGKAYEDFYDEDDREPTHEEVEENIRKEIERVRLKVEAGSESSRHTLEVLEKEAEYYTAYVKNEKKLKFKEGLNKLQASKDRYELGNDVIRLRKELREARRQVDLERAKHIHAELGDTQSVRSVHELEEKIRILNKRIHQGAGEGRTQAEEFADQTALADAERKLFKLLYHRDDKEDEVEQEISSQTSHTPEEAPEQKVIEPEVLEKETIEDVDILPEKKPEEKIIDVTVEEEYNGENMKLESFPQSPDKSEEKTPEPSKEEFSYNKDDPENIVIPEKGSYSKRSSEEVERGALFVAQQQKDSLKNEETPVFDIKEKITETREKIRKAEDARNEEEVLRLEDEIRSLEIQRQTQDTNILIKDIREKIRKAEQSGNEEEALALEDELHNLEQGIGNQKNEEEKNNTEDRKQEQTQIEGGEVTQSEEEQAQTKEDERGVIEPEVLDKETTETEGNEAVQSEKEPEEKVIDIPTETSQDAQSQEAQKEGQIKKWEDMTVEERREKYGKTFETRERLHQFNKERANLVVLEHGLSIRDRQNIANMENGDPDAKLSKRARSYVETLEKYKDSRAGYVGAKAWRMLKENKRLAEEQSHEHEKGIFEKVRTGWRWLGEQNLENFLDKKGIKIEGKWKKIGARMISLRTTAGLGLLAGGTAVGFGSAVGITALATRRAMGGAGLAFGSYDMMRNAHEKKTLSLDTTKLGEMSVNDLEQNMASFEVSAKYSGERIVQGDEYGALRREYARRLEDNDAGNLTETMQTLDTTLRGKQLDLARKERNRKGIALGIGALGIGAFSHSDISSFATKKAEELSSMGAEFIAGTKETVNKWADSISSEDLNEMISSAKEIAEKIGVTAQKYIQFIQTGIMTTGEQLEEAVLSEAQIPDEIISAAESPIAENVITLTGAEGIASGMETVEGIMETVKGGGSAWKAAQRLVENSLITKEEFAEAWSSPASVIATESGETVHISELGLTHSGDQIIYVPTTENVPAHFNVIDYTKDTLRVGNNSDLAEAFESKGIKNPEWLNDALGVEAETTNAPQGIIEENVAEVAQVDDATDTIENIEAKNINEEAQRVDNNISIETAMAGELSFAEGAYNFDWGEARFIVSPDGNIGDVYFNENITSIERIKLVEKATNELLKPDFKEIIEAGTEGSQQLMPNNIAVVKHSAWEVQRLQDVFESISDKSSVEANFLRGKIEAVVMNNELTFGKIFKPVNV